MATYGALLNIVIPIFFLLFGIEKWVEWRRGAQVIRGLDSVASFSSGITNVVKDVLGLSIGIISYHWMEQHLALTHIKASWLVYVVAFVAVDFQGYWAHRWSHEINLLWNRHIIHHSSEEFNLSCALRQSVSEVFNYFTFLLLPAALLGIPVQVVAIVGPLHLFLQYWYHTRLIDKMGILEHLLVTPSHHRVHHAMNDEYLDKNYGQVFIVWDKWFGTFQEELAQVPPVYGVKRPVRTWNPFRINFQHFWLMCQDAWRAQRWWDKARLWFMPTGWRPADVAAAHPVDYVADVYALQKYDTPASRGLLWWSWLQVLFCYVLLVYFFAHLEDIGAPGIYLYGAFIFFSIFAYTEVMDGRRGAVYLELARAAAGFYLIYAYQGWFGVEAHWGQWYSWLVGGGLALSAAAAVYLSSYTPAPPKPKPEARQQASQVTA